MRLQVYVDALFGQVDVVQRLVPIAQLFQQRLFLSTVSCCLHDDCYDTLQILHVHVNPLQKKLEDQSSKSQSRSLQDRY